MNEQTEAQQLEQFKKLLEAEKQEFLAVMSHELRTPMTGVKGYLSMLLDGDAGELGPKTKDYVAQAYVANERLIRLVDQMFKTASLQEGQIKFKIIKVDLVEQVELLIHDFTFPANDKKITLSFKKPEHKVWVEADPDRLREIIAQLLSNALKFTPGDQNGQISVRIELNHSVAKIIVKDSGIGIEKRSQNRLFELFTKANLTLTGQEKGTGLGLYFAKKLAQAQSGDVWLEESEVNKGSTFIASFPLINI
jgi:signal transduction histidine kinase